MSDHDNIKIYTKIPGEIFTDALTTAINTMTGFNVEPNIDYIEEAETGKDIIGTMVLFGEKKLLVMLTASKNTAALLVTYMTGTDPDELTEAELCDGITEFINIVGGSARAALENSNYRFVISVPFTITGQDMKVIVKKRMERYFVSFNSNEFEMHFKIFEL